MKLLRAVALLAAILSGTGLAAAERLELEVLHVSVVLDNVQQKALQLELTPPSRDAFADFTRRHLDETIYVSIDGEAVMSPRLMEPITGGVLVISGMFAAGEVEAIGKRISAADARVEVSTQD